MLREVTSASNDGACLDADPATLGALWEAALPSPAQSVIALHRACWRALQASAESLKARGEWEWRSELMWPAEDAEDEAVMDLLMTSCRDRADAEAMLSHLMWYLQVRPQHPKRPAMSGADAALIAVRLRDLSMILGRSVAGAAPAALPGAIAVFIAEHRAAWSAYLAEFDVWEKSEDRYFALKDAAGESSEVVSRAPCADRAEAAAFVAHVAWYRAELEAAGDSLADGFTTEAQEMRARAGDLAVWIGVGAAAPVA